MNRRRIGGGGIAYTYTEEEEKQQARKKAAKNVLPLIAELVIDLHEGSGGKTLKAGRAGSTKSENPKIEKLKNLLNDLK